MRMWRVTGEIVNIGGCFLKARDAYSVLRRYIA